MTDAALGGAIFLAIMIGILVFWMLLCAVGVTIAVLFVRAVTKPVANFGLWTLSSSYGWIEYQRQRGKLPARR